MNRLNTKIGQIYGDWQMVAWADKAKRRLVAQCRVCGECVEMSESALYRGYKRHICISEREAIARRAPGLVSQKIMLEWAKRQDTHETAEKLGITRHAVNDTITRVRRWIVEHA